MTEGVSLWDSSGVVDVSRKPRPFLNLSKQKGKEEKKKSRATVRGERSKSPGGKKGEVKQSERGTIARGPMSVQKRDAIKRGKKVETMKVGHRDLIGNGSKDGRCDPGRGL